MSTNIYSKLCEIFEIEQSNPIPNSKFNKIHNDELISHGRPVNAFPKGHVPWNKGLTKKTNETIKNIGNNVSIARKKYYEEWHKHNIKKTYQKKGYENSAKVSRELAIERNKIQITCPHCNKKGQLANIKRWHFENCNELRTN